MKVFISWSGDRSKSIADVLRRWIPGVLQAVKPYFSPDDIAKGSRWSGEIAKELEASRIGLLVLTPENLDSAWLMFEAGALAKNLEKAKVCPLLFGLEPTDVKGPLVQFQAARFGIDEMKRVVKMINAELADGSLPADVLDSVFAMWWPKLEQDVAALLKVEEGPEEKPRSERDLIEEVLELARSLSRDVRRNDGIHPAALDDLASSYSRLVRALAHGGPTEVASAASELYHPLYHVCIRGSGRSPRGRPASHLAETRELLQAMVPRFGSATAADKE